jgi:hypothetical protein
MTEYGLLLFFSGEQIDIRHKVLDWLPEHAIIIATPGVTVEDGVIEITLQFEWCSGYGYGDQDFASAIDVAFMLEHFFDFQ